jgi:hypothetical protein
MPSQWLHTFRLHGSDAVLVSWFIISARVLRPVKDFHKEMAEWFIWFQVPKLPPGIIPGNRSHLYHVFDSTKSSTQKVFNN